MMGGCHQWVDHNHETFDASKWIVVPMSCTQSALMHRGHDTKPHTMIFGDEVFVNGQLQWKRPVVQRPVTPPLQKTLVVDKTFSRTCISASPYQWSQQTGWYQKKIGIITEI
jgi:hypothetical protein